MQIGRMELADGGIVAVGRMAGSDKWRRVEGNPLRGPVLTGLEVEGRLLAPVVPPAIYCIGMNYAEHARETGKPIPEFPVVFMKAPTAVLDPEGTILLPPESATRTVDYEVELGVVIGRDCRDVSEDDALEVVAGYTIGNDVSARNWQTARGGGQFCRAKTFDTFCPLGPWMVTADEIPDPQLLGVRTSINGERMQDSNTGDMLFGVARLIEFLSVSTTLAAGTLILAGTPEGVGVARTPPVYLKRGDIVEMEIDRIGRLRNSVG